MNGKRLQLEDGIPLDLWICECGSIYRQPHLANMCCEPKFCDCGAPRDEVYYTRCAACREVERLERLSKVEEVPAESVEMLFSQELDRYFTDIDDLVSHCEDDEISVPEWAYACKPVRISIDATDVMDHEEERVGWDSYDMGEPPWQGVEEFRAACAAFQEANFDHVVTHSVDFTRKVRVAEGSVMHG